MNRRQTWQVVSAVSGAVAALAVRQIGMMLWQRSRHEAPPRHPADQTVSWSDALIWATSAAVGAAVARVLAQRGAAAAWTAATGAPPPDLEPS
jgi:hypothetical protein